MSKSTALKLILALSLVSISLFGASAKSFATETTAKKITRVAVLVDGSQTQVWLSDFPAKVSVVLYDAENNLLGIVSTNQYGAAYTNFKSIAKTTVNAKTINGEIVVSNKAFTKEEKTEQATAASQGETGENA